MMNEIGMPTLVAAGLLQLGGRDVPCAVLSDGRRVVFDVPVPGILDDLTEDEREALTVRYEGHDGAPLEGIDSAELVDVAMGWVEKARSSKTERNMRIAEGCMELLRALAMIGLRAYCEERA